MSLQTSAQDSNRRQIKSLIDSGLAYRTSSSLKIIKEWKTVNNTSSFKILSALFTNISIETKRYIFDYFKTVQNLYDSEDTPFDIILIRKYSKLFRIVAKHNKFALRIAIQKIKEFIQLPKFLKNLPFLIKQISLKTLACHFKAKLFKLKMISGTRQKYVYSNLKVRYLMSVCENYLSKKDISKDLYNGFRQWYLRTTIKTLYILDSEMTPLIRRTVGIAAKTLDIVLKRTKKSAFLALITNQFYKWNLPRNIRRRQELYKLAEIINTIYARFISYRQLFQIPHNGNTQKLFRMAQGFNYIKSCKRYKFNKRNIKAMNLLFDIFRYRKLSAACTFFRLPSKKLIFNRSIKYEDKPTIGADKIYWFLYKKSKAAKLFFYDRVKSFNEYKLIIAYQKRAILKHILRNQYQKDSLKMQAFKIWKTSNLKARYSKFATDIIFSTILDMKIKVLSNSFYKLKNNINLRKIISEQSSKIKALQELHSIKSIDINRLKKIKVLAFIIIRDNQRFSNNKGIINKYFHRWLQQIPFSNSKLNEYNQLLDIIENENNYLKEEINEIHQEAPSPLGLQENKIESKMKFLEFLEIQNSELIENLENIDIIRDSETREIELELLGRPKRSYSF